jgi:thiamine biosynthesis lipoprotein
MRRSLGFMPSTRRFSTFKGTSEINRLDRCELQFAGCSPDMREVLAACADLWRQTDGFFDLYATGRLDPSGYVKGWAFQVASERLTAAGAVNHYVEAGGDLQTRGEPSPGRPWHVGIRHPWERDKVCFVVAGTDLAVATSRLYERGLHVINPRSGQPRTC